MLASNNESERKNAEDLYRKLRAILDESPLPLSAIWHAILDEDDRESTYALTIDGATELLLRTGYLIETTSADS